jgi:hypothetical protein
MERVTRSMPSFQSRVLSVIQIFSDDLALSTTNGSKYQTIRRLGFMSPSGISV